MNEQGLKFDLVAWYGLFAPAGTPAAVVNALNQEVNRILQAPEMADKLKAIGLSDWPVKTPEQFAETVRRDVRDLRPRDMIDLQSFIWVQGSDEYEE